MKFVQLFIILIIAQSLLSLTDFSEYSQECNLLVSSSSDKTIKIWDTNNNYELKTTITGHKDAVYGIILYPDCKSIISASDDATIR